MTLLSVRREVGEFRKRYKWMALVVVIVFCVLIGRAAYLQLVQHEHFAAIARENITRTITLPATRGILRDATGRIVATNRPAYNVYVTPLYMDLERDVPRIAALMGLDAPARKALYDKLARIPERRRSHQIEIFRDITRDQLAALQTHLTEFQTQGAVNVTYLDVTAVPVRTYPFGELAAHAIGYLNEVNAEDIARLGSGYRAGDSVGRSGIEAAWESYVRGRRGYKRVLVDSHGRDVEAGGTQEVIQDQRDPVPGRDLSLTLDMELMRIVERAFRGQPSGGAVVVDVRTGRVRALFSKPSYDLNEMSGRLSPERASEIQNNPFRPLIDKTIYETYFPGSTFKPIAAFAALEAGIRDASHHVQCIGYYQIGENVRDRKHCTRVHGDVDMRSALVQSCNVYFYELAYETGLDHLNRYALDFGLGERTGIGINTESSGFIPSRAWYIEHYERFRPGFTLNEAIGQGNMRVTLLQLAMAYAAIANGGTLYVPQLVQEVRAPDGSLIEEFQPRVRRRVSVSREHLTYVIDGLYGVVNDPTGTAYDARIRGGVPMAGKTGTAQVFHRAPRPGEDDRSTWYYNRDHAWFAGFAPAGDPELAIIVLVEHGGVGGRTAAPIATEILQNYLGERPAEAGSDTRTAQAPTRPRRGG